MLSSIKAHALKEGWINEKDWSQIVTMSQLFPGAIAVNVAHLIGFHAGKRLGSFFSVIGMVIPSIILILLVATLLQPYLSHPLVLGALRGILIAVIFLIFKALFDLARPLQWTWMTLLLASGSFLLVYLNILTAFWVIVLSFSLASIHFMTRRKK